MKLLMKILLFVGVTALGFGGCAPGDLGSRCDFELECEEGLQCLATSNGGAGVCTISCASEACSSGTCLTTADGLLCTADCASSEDCSSGLTCGSTADSDGTCWFSGDGISRLPAESSGVPCGEAEDCAPGFDCVASGAAPSNGAGRCALPCATTSCQTGQCVALAEGEYCLDMCDGSLSCTLDRACLRTPDREFVCWEDDPNLAPPPTGVIVDRIERVNDTNGDGIWSKNESGCFSVFARNLGASDAPYVSASVTTSASGVSLDHAATGGGSICTYTNPLTLDANSARDLPIVNPHFVLTGSPPSTIPFAVTFTDSLGNTWNDTFQMQAAP